MMGKLPNPPQEVNMQALMMDNQNVESIEAGLKQNLPQLFANLTVKPEGWLQLQLIILTYFYLLNLLPLPEWKSTYQNISQISKKPLALQPSMSRQTNSKKINTLSI